MWLTPAFLFPQANNWCSKTYTTLEEMERKTSGCEHSADARELIGEVDGYITFTKGDQEARVQKVCICMCMCVCVGGGGSSMCT